MSSIYDLENLLNDPDYFWEEYFGQVRNIIDIRAEEEKLKEEKKETEINEEREKLFSELNEIKQECKRSFTDGVFNEEIAKIRHFMSTFDSKEENSQQKLQENINIMKLILLRFRSYHFIYDDYLKIGAIQSKVLY